MHVPKRAGTGLFFLIALGSTWTLQLPAVLAKHGLVRGTVESWMPLAALGAFGPLVAAVIAARLEERRAGVRALFRPTRAGGVSAHWYALALLAFGAIHVAGVAVFKALGGSGAQWLYPPENAQQIAALLIVPIAEEPGWRGFALPRLQARHGPLKATLLLGALWAAWHTMMFVLQAGPGLAFLAATANILAGSFVFTWLYNRTGGSLVIAIVAHAGAHLNNPSHALPGNPTSFLVYTAAICVVACVLLIADRRTWRPDGGKAPGDRRW